MGNKNCFTYFINSFNVIAYQSNSDFILLLLSLQNDYPQLYPQFSISYPQYFS